MKVRVAFVVVFVSSTYLIPTAGFPGLDGLPGLPGLPTGGAGGGLWGMFGALVNNQVTQKVAGFVESVVDKIDNVHDNTNKAFGNVKANLKAMTGVIDGPTLVQIIEPKMNKEDIVFSECLNNIKVELTGVVRTQMTLYKGKVNFEDTNFKIEGSHEDEDLGETQVLKILFQFTDLLVPYVLKASSLMTREGYVVFKLKGVSTMIARVEVTSEADKIRALAKEDNCFITVQGLISDLSKKIEIAESDYNSFIKGITNKGITDIAIKKITSNVESVKILKKFVSEGLLEMLKPILTDHRIFCESSDLSLDEPKVCGGKSEVVNMNIKPEETQGTNKP